MFYWRPSRSCSLNGTLVERSALKLAPFPLRLWPSDQLTPSPASPFQWPLFATSGGDFFLGSRGCGGAGGGDESALG